MTWHPLLDVREGEPSVWTLVDQRGDYGTVRLLKDGERRFYRGWLHNTLLGEFPTLRVAVEKVHLAYIRSHGPQGEAPNPWPTRDVR